MYGWSLMTLIRSSLPAVQEAFGYNGRVATACLLDP